MSKPEQENEEWMPLSHAAKEVGISQTKLSRMVTAGLVDWRESMRDFRVTLVNVTQLRHLLGDKHK